MRRDEGKRTRVFTRRALVVMAGQTAALTALGAKLYQVQIDEGAKYATLAESNRISARLIAPPRGQVLDRFGEVLAGNTLNWRALLMPEETADLRATLDNFSRLLPLEDHDRARIERELKHKRRFIPVTLKEFLDWDQMARIEVNAPDLPGVLVDVGTTRHYPLGPDLAHIVGYVAPPSEADVGDDPLLGLPGIRMGRAGVEQFYEDDLRGEAGRVQMEVNAVGRVIRELDRKEGTPGDAISLTIDSTLQRTILGRLADMAASAVVMDCTNGAVLAMTTTPSFDPSLFDSGVSEKQWIEWTSNRRTPLINKATAGVYPPGSTFKMAVGMAGLRSGGLTLGDRIYCPGYLDMGDTRFHCWRKAGHGSLDFHGALKHSCDVFFFELARRIGIDTIAQTANLFSFGTDTGVDLPGARKGLMPTQAWRRKHGHQWNIGDTISCGIGQGFVEATPLQLATYVSRIATGRAVVPHVGGRVGDRPLRGTAADDFPALDVDEAFLAAARGGMFAVVNERDGTAPHARLEMPGVQMAGKTGSSQVRRVSRWVREHGHFNSASLPWEFRPHALFVCFAPYDAPRYAVSVVVEHGNAGAAMAAPLARDIMQDTLVRDPARRQVGGGQTVAQQ